MRPLPEPPPPRPNTAFRRLRGQLSPSEFAASVRRAAREIGEQVCCDARYIGRVESGAIRCPNYAYERVFRHMFPDRALTDMGFTPRETVRGHGARAAGSAGPWPEPGPDARRVPGQGPAPAAPAPDLGAGLALAPGPAPAPEPAPGPGPVPVLDPDAGLRHTDATKPRTGPAPGALSAPGAGLGPAAARTPGPRQAADHVPGPGYAAYGAGLVPDQGPGPGREGPLPPAAGAAPTAGPAPAAGPGQPVDVFEESELLRRAFVTGGAAAAAGVAGPRVAEPRRRVGEAEAVAMEEAVRRIRVLDDRHGADTLYAHTAKPLSAAYALLDAGGYSRSIAERLHAGAGELAISVGWLAHDSGRLSDARSHYAEALATARVTGDPALEAHAFCNTAFLARDAGRPREAVRAAQAAQRIAKRLASPRLLSLLALREAGGWAWMSDRGACEQALLRAQTLFGRGPSDADPEWMSFYGEAELEGLEAQCWSALGDWRRATEHARRAVSLQDPHFTRNIALFTTELASDLVADGAPDAAAAAASRTLGLLDQVKSSRIRRMLDDMVRVLRPHGRDALVADFLARYEAAGRPRPA